jgi:hypothetical protein
MDRRLSVLQIQSGHSVMEEKIVLRRESNPVRPARSLVTTLTDIFQYMI